MNMFTRIPKRLWYSGSSAQRDRARALKPEKRQVDWAEKLGEMIETIGSALAKAKEEQAGSTDTQDSFLQFLTTTVQALLNTTPCSKSQMDTETAQCQSKGASLDGTPERSSSPLPEDQKKSSKITVQERAMTPLTNCLDGSQSLGDSTEEVMVNIAPK